MINKDELDGKAKQIKGKVKQGFGDLTDDEQLRDEGEADEAEGEVAGRHRRGAPEGRRGHRGDRREGQALDLSFRKGLDPPEPLCYICKVLVGPGTPYLGPDSKTRRHMRESQER